MTSFSARTLWEALEQAAAAIGLPTDDALEGTLTELRDRGATIQYDGRTDQWRAMLP
jgi:hypothetical protein